MEVNAAAMLCYASEMRGGSCPSLLLGRQVAAAIDDLQKNEWISRTNKDNHREARGRGRESTTDIETEKYVSMPSWRHQHQPLIDSEAEPRIAVTV